MQRPALRRRQDTLSLLGRIALASGGGFAAVSGLRRGGVLGTALAIAGSALAVDAVRRHPIAAQMLLEVQVRPRIVRSVHRTTIGRPRSEVFRFWRDFPNLKHVLPALVQVEAVGPGRTLWVARGPRDVEVAWESDILEERENELIRWRAEGQLPHVGQVEFQGTPGGQDTEVRLEFGYVPPLGSVGRGIAALFGSSPEQQAEAALQRLKEHLESAGSSLPLGRRYYPMGQE